MYGDRTLCICNVFIDWGHLLSRLMGWLAAAGGADVWRFYKNVGTVAVICRNYSVAHIPIRRDATAIRSADTRVNLQ